VAAAAGACVSAGGGRRGCCVAVADARVGGRCGAVGQAGACGSGAAACGGASGSRGVAHGDCGGSVGGAGDAARAATCGSVWWWRSGWRCGCGERRGTSACARTRNKAGGEDGSGWGRGWRRQRRREALRGCKRCNAVIPPHLLLLAVGAGATPSPPTPTHRLTRRQRRAGGETRVLRLPATGRGWARGIRCKPAHRDAAVQRRDAIAPPQRPASGARTASTGRLPLLLRTSIRAPASSSTRTASRRPFDDATCSALSPRLLARVACDAMRTHTTPPPPVSTDAALAW
jgi:hypothetical protein